VESPPIKPVTTRINLHCADCRCCRNTITAEPPADMPPGSPFGPGIVALVTYLHGCQMVGYARLAEMLIIGWKGVSSYVVSALPGCA
jgi:transposase